MMNYCMIKTLYRMSNFKTHAWSKTDSPYFQIQQPSEAWNLFSSLIRLNTVLPINFNTLVNIFTTVSYPIKKAINLSMAAAIDFVIYLPQYYGYSNRIAIDSEKF